MTLAKAAAIASLLLLLLNGAGGFAALLSLIIPGEGARFFGAGGFIRAALSLAAFLSETITEGETCLLLRDLDLCLL